MKNQEELERIEAFLSGSLVDADRNKFEAELASNAELKENYRILKSLKENPITEEEYDFIRNVKNLKAPNFSKYKKWTIIVLLIGLLVSSFLLVHRMLNKTEPQTQISPIAEVKPNVSPFDPNVDPKTEYSDNNERKVKGTPKPEPRLVNKLPTKISNIESKPSTTVADRLAKEESNQASPNSKSFSENKDLELLISSMKSNRSSISNFTLSDQPASAKHSDEAFRFKLKGTYVSTEPLGEDKIVIYIFDNKLASYNSFLPLMKLYPDIEIRDEEYRLSSDKKLSLETGLYYYLIEIEKKEELLYVGKFNLS